MKKILLCLILLVLMQKNAVGQEFTESNKFRITKINQSQIEQFYTDNESPNGESSIYIIDNQEIKLKELKVYIESYENDAIVEENIDPKLKNVKKIIRVLISHCACYCNTEIYFWLITKKGKWIGLPTIEQEDYELGMKYNDYVFSINNPNEFQLIEYQDEFLEKGVYDIDNIQRKSEKVLKTYTWNGKEILEK